MFFADRTWITIVTLSMILVCVPISATASNSDVAKIKNYTARTARLEMEYQMMHKQMVDAMFSFAAEHNHSTLDEFSADYDQGKNILYQLIYFQEPSLKNEKAEQSMTKVRSLDRQWGLNAKNELNQMLHVGRSLTVSQYFTLVKQEDARGTDLTNQSIALTSLALRQEGLSNKEAMLVLFGIVEQATK